MERSTESLKEIGYQGVRHGYRVMVALMSGFTELFCHYSDNPAFKRWLPDRNFEKTYTPTGAT